MQFSASCTGLKLKGPVPCILRHSGIQVRDLARNCEDLLVGFVKKQLLLPLEVLPQPQYGL